MREIRTLRVMWRELETGLWTHVPVTAPVPDPVGAKVLGPLALPAKRVVKHPAKSDPVDASGMDAEPQDAARELIHDDRIQ